MLSVEHKETNTCVSCGYGVDGKFCTQCGEKVLNEKDKSVFHFFEEFIHILTHADSKFLRSLKYLFTKPGHLTAEYLKGRRKLYATPLSLFFIGNLLYFLILPTDALNTQYAVQTQGQSYSKLIAPVGEKKMQERHWTPEQMEENYDHESGKISKMMLVLLVMLFSIPTSLLFYRRDRYYFDHVVFATEFLNFIIYVVFLVAPFVVGTLFVLISFIIQRRVFPDLNSPITISILMGILWLYLYTAAKRVYKQSIVLPQTIALVFCCVAMVLVYRFILFYLTIWAL